MDQLVLIVPISSALVIYWARIRELKTVRDTVKGEIRENLTLRLFIAVGSLMLVGSIAEQIWFRRPLSAPLLIAGWTLALCSFWLRRRAIRALGKMWSLHVEIRAQHQLVMSGPYRWMRHPAYSSMVLELASFSLLLQSIYSSILVALLFVPTLLLRIKIEETALREQVAGYSEYQRCTPALLPYKIPGPVQS
ncbi:MAG TPA: isoprenylcysteine carboxylmethyltransferase family protein [Polyangiaceae bacterium]|nr:isoprenylcysteine carboxylmethyltransferase family protein [Polyangiaceae bacterium]